MAGLFPLNLEKLIYYYKLCFKLNYFNQYNISFDFWFIYSNIIYQKDFWYIFFVYI